MATFTKWLPWGVWHDTKRLLAEERKRGKASVNINLAGRARSSLMHFLFLRVCLPWEVLVGWFITFATTFYGEENLPKKRVFFVALCLIKKIKGWFASNFMGF